MNNYILKNWIKRSLLTILVFIVAFGLISCNKTVEPEDKFIKPTPVKTADPVDYDYFQPLENVELDQWASNLPLIDEYDTENEARNKAFYIVSSPGENANTMININYHTRSAKTNVEYTLKSDTDFANKKIAPQKCYVFSDDDSRLAAPFEARNICRVNIKDLTPNTEYQYRVNNGDNTYSDIYSFKTAGSAETSFLFMSDAHYYIADNGAEVNEKLIQKAVEIQPNINLLFTTGDWIDTAGQPGDWEVLFKRSESFKSIPFLGVPGNHEYYNAQHTGNKIFSAHFNFPLNGVDGFKGASYYTIYNNILFFQIDNQTGKNFQLQMEWIERTIYNNPTKFIIIGMHTPINIENQNHDYDRPFLDIVEKHSVDLVLSGHYHTDNYQPNVYYDEVYTGKNEYLGVTYLNGFYGGVKGKPAGSNELDYARGYIIDTEGDNLKIRYIDATGRVRAERIVKNKKTAPVQEATKEELFNSISQNFNEETLTLSFNWSEKFYGNVDRVLIQSNYRDKGRTYLTIPTPAYTFHHIRNINLDYDYSHTITVFFKDKTSMTKTFEFNSSIKSLEPTISEITSKTVKVSYEIPDKYTYLLNDYEIYLNGELRAVYKALDADFQPVLSNVLTHLTADTNYELVIKAYGRSGYFFHGTTTFKTAP